jgi:hypothetical protein
MIDGRPIKEQAYQGCTGILRLTGTYSPSRVEAACKLALRQSNSIVYRTIANILINNRDAGVDNAPPPFQLPSHENLRGSGSYN